MKMEDVEVILHVYFFKLILQIDITSTSCEIGLSQVPENPNDYDKSTLVQTR